MDRTIIPGSVWRHFKGTTAKVITVAKHSETGEELVIYECSGNEGKTNHTDGTYARPKDMFLSEVDHEKYPDVKQKYRLEKISDITSDAENEPEMIEDFITEMRSSYPSLQPRAAFAVAYIDTALEYPSGAAFRPRIVLAPEFDVENDDQFKRYIDGISAESVTEAYRNQMDSEPDKGLYTKDSQLVVFARGQVWQLDNGSFFVNDNYLGSNTKYVDGKQMVGSMISEAMKYDLIEIG